MRKKTGAWTAAVVLAVGALPLQAAPPAEGRWEGVAEIPLSPQVIVVDLEPDKEGTWHGSVVLPGRGVKGAPLRELVVDDARIAFSLTSAMPFPADPPPVVSMHLQEDGLMHGQLDFAGLSAPMALHRTGAAQVDVPPLSTPVEAALAGSWSGSFELFGYPRQVSLDLAGTGATMVIVGQRTTRVEFELVQQNGRFLALSGNGYDISFEGDWQNTEGLIDGTFMMGSIALPLQFRRAGE